ncbi:MAG: alanine--tRNA ligase [Acidimicrobiia bacterium]
MDSNRIRRTFLEFFAARDHEIVPSASLIPIDPTLLLTSAGMVPFKPYMLGEESAPYDRAVSSQKCARTSDIDVVGTTARHITFFEMLGNFSFGDYFKEGAIPWAYELATEGFGLDPDRIWYTVHHTDDEAAEIWIDGVGVDPEHVQRRGEDNFWHMGVPGPCGPSSELFYDKGPDHGPDGGPVVDEERFMEFWNLVFMQNVQDEPFHVVGDLPKRNIDTGLGLERFAVLMQDVTSVFETDLVRPVLAAAERACSLRLGDDERTDVSLRIMADHGRAVTVLSGDGVVPSNEGRGYVLRRLLRRSVRHAFLHDAKDPVMAQLVSASIEVLGEAYPDLVENADYITEMVDREEHAFRRTLASGSTLLDTEIGDLGEGSTLDGFTAFKLHDTYGFPIDVTAEILAERGLELDRDGFEVEMDAQRRRSREAYRGGDDAARQKAYVQLIGGTEVSVFTGYEEDKGVGRILAIVREGETTDRAEAGEGIEVFLDRTPFYAESGGQVGDAGRIVTETGALEVDDTRYALPGVHGHRSRVVAGYVHTGQDATLSIASARREQIRKNHTGTHLLHWGLRQVVGDHVHQAGSLVDADRLRFDFSNFAALDPDELAGVERTVNERIIENAAVTTREMTRSEAEEAGAIAFFGDKYGEVVRVVDAGGYSVEFCGGTHVGSTGQVGPLILVTEGSVAANTRRIEAVTGTTAYEHLVSMRREVEQAEDILRAQRGQLIGAVEAVTSRVRDQQSRIEEFEAQSRSRLADTMLAGAERLGDRGIVAATAAELAATELRVLALQVRDRLGSGIGVIGSAREGKGALVVFVSSDLVDAGISAGDIVTAGASVLGGGGSRDAALAQAGGPRGGDIEEAVGAAAGVAREALASR